MFCVTGVDCWVLMNGFRALWVCYAYILILLDYSDYYFGLNSIALFVG